MSKKSKRKYWPELEAKEQRIKDKIMLRDKEERGILCINCGQVTLGCFIGPSFGDKGFFTCTQPGASGIQRGEIE